MIFFGTSLALCTYNRVVLLPCVLHSAFTMQSCPWWGLGKSRQAFTENKGRRRDTTISEVKIRRERGNRMKECPFDVCKEHLSQQRLLCKCNVPPPFCNIITTWVLQSMTSEKAAVYVTGSDACNCSTTNTSRSLIKPFYF